MLMLWLQKLPTLTGSSSLKFHEKTRTFSNLGKQNVLKICTDCAPTDPLWYALIVHQLTLYDMYWLCTNWPFMICTDCAPTHPLWYALIVHQLIPYDMYWLCTNWPFMITDIVVHMKVLLYLLDPATVIQHKIAENTKFHQAVSLCRGIQAFVGNTWTLVVGCGSWGF